MRGWGCGTCGNHLCHQACRQRRNSVHTHKPGVPGATTWFCSRVFTISIGNTQHVPMMPATAPVTSFVTKGIFTSCGTVSAKLAHSVSTTCSCALPPTHEATERGSTITRRILPRSTVLRTSVVLRADTRVRANANVGATPAGEGAAATPAMRALTPGCWSIVHREANVAMLQ